MVLVLLVSTLKTSAGRLRCSERFRSMKPDTIRSLYGRIRYIEVRLTGSEGIASTKTVHYTQGFVVSRFVVSKLTPALLRAANAHMRETSERLNSLQHTLRFIRCGSKFNVNKSICQDRANDKRGLHATWRSRKHEALNALRGKFWNNTCLSFGFRMCNIMHGCVRPVKSSALTP